MKKKAIQLANHSRTGRAGVDSKIIPEQALAFLNEFQLLMQGDEGPTRLISLRVPERLLEVFRARCSREGRRYQTRILELMREWARAARPRL